MICAKLLLSCYCFSYKSYLRYTRLQGHSWRTQLWMYLAFQNSLFPLVRCFIFLEPKQKLISYYILLSLHFVYLRNCSLVNCSCQFFPQKFHLSEVWKARIELSMFLWWEFYYIFLWCIVTKLSLSSKSWKDDDLLL